MKCRAAVTALNDLSKSLESATSAAEQALPICIFVLDVLVVGSQSLRLKRRWRVMHDQRCFSMVVLWLTV
jgi:hypothetical protein